MIRAELIDHMGDDLRVTNAARVSFAKESHALCHQTDCCNQLGCDYSEGLSDKDQKLIKYLAAHGHFTPFTHPQITIRETVPIFVARQRFKHVVGFTYNEKSRRYVDDTPEFYIPEAWRSRPDGSVKQGSGNEMPEEDQKWLNGHYDYFLNSARQVYEDMLELGVAPEQARMVLPQSMLTSYYVTGSLSAWARAYKLRIDSHAQKEIQDLARQWDRIIKPLFPVSWAALT